MATLLNVQHSLDDKTPTARPSWVNAELCTIGETVILHSGGGELAGSWHSQNSDEILLVLAGVCTVDTDGGPIQITAGSLIHIQAGEAHKVSTEPGTHLVAIESTTATRTSLDRTLA